MAEEISSVEATIESNGQGCSTGAEASTCNNNDAAGAVDDGEKSLEAAEELMEKGLKAAKEQDYSEAADCYSRALEIRVAHFGELAPECVYTYYKYGCVLLYKNQDEADALGAMPKKDGKSQQGSGDKDGSIQDGMSGESSVTSAFNITEQNGNTKLPEIEPEKVSSGKDDEGDDEEDTNELDEADEDESDLDLAWKMLDLARAITEKSPGDTMEKVDILSALAEVALEREDVETSLSDYLKALGMLERLVEPDSRRIAELNFRICLCVEIGSKTEEAIPYCQKAISICKSRVDRLNNELKSSTGSTLAASELDQAMSSSGSISNDDAKEKEEEIKTLTELLNDLEKKLEDLQQPVANPKSVLSDILAIMSAKAKAGSSNMPPVMNSSQLGVASGSGGDVDSPTVSTAHTNGAVPVTHLGVVGRGVKRVVMSTVTTEDANPTKKLELDTAASKEDDDMAGS